MTARTQRAPITLPLPVTRPEHWTEGALCARPGANPAWFDAPHDGETLKEREARIGRAKGVCARCTVTTECADAIVPEDEGIRAGHLLGERVRELKAITHGTANGAHDHRLRGEQPCDPCMEAQRTYRRELKKRNAS